MNLLTKLQRRWRGSIRLRHSIGLSLTIVFVMGIASTVMLYEQDATIRKAAEDRGLAFSRTFASMGAVGIHNNLFRIQESMGKYLQDPDVLQIDFIDRQNMIMAAKHPERIGTYLTEVDWLVPSQSNTELINYRQDSLGEHILVIVEPLFDKEEIQAWVRIIFSLAHVRQDLLQAIKRMAFVTLALVVVGIIAVQIAQQQIAQVFHGIIGRLHGTLAALGFKESPPVFTSDEVERNQGRPPPGQGELEHLTEVVSQTTDLVQRQSHELRESRELLQAILDNTTAVIYVKDTEGRYMLISRQYELLFHVTSEQALGKTDYDIFPRVIADAFYANDMRVLHSGSPLELEEITPHDDELHTYLSLKVPLRDAAGIPYGLCGISTDITQRKKAQDALQSLTSSLEQKVQERTAELEVARDQALIATQHKSEFMAGMSHELRTPLNAVIGFSEVLLEKMFGELNPKQEDYLQDILSSGRHLLALINDILDLAKIESGRMELELTTFDLPTLLRDTLTLMRERATRHGIEATLEIDSRLGDCTADERKVKQTLLNLLSNALKFTPDGGKILVKAIPNREHVEISVSDNGIGIAPDYQEKIFKEFYQAEGNYTGKREGTGLGLALTKKFVELHGGRIWVESEVGRGSVFTFSLPIRESVEKAAVLSIKTPSVQQERPLVLVVEDDPSAGKLLSLFLTEAGFAVELANTGEVGLEKVRTLRPGVITLDILMQGLDGWEFLSCLKNDRNIAGIPVVIVSILDERGKGFALGAAEYLVKPVDREDVISAVRRLARTSFAQPNWKILIVDDDPMVLELMQAVLEPEGFTVLKAGSGREGMTLAQQQRPHLIVLDLLMPDVDGFQVLDELKRTPLTASIPIVILTCKALSLSEKAVLNGRISDLVQKGGFNRADFVLQIRSLLELEPYSP